MPGTTPDENAQSFGDNVRRWTSNLHSDAGRFTLETQSALINLSWGESSTERSQIYPWNQQLLAAERDDCGGSYGNGGEEGVGGRRRLVAAAAAHGGEGGDKDLGEWDQR